MLTPKRALALLLVVLCTALPASAQDLTQTFASPDGSVSFNYPAGWAADAQTVPTGDGGQITLAFLASNQSAATKIGNTDTMVLDSGEVLIGITIGQLGAMFNTTPDASALDLLSSATEASGESYGMAMPFTINNRPAARTGRSAAGYDELDIAIAYGGGIYGYLALYAPAGESSFYEDTLLGIAESIQHGEAVPVALEPTDLTLRRTFTTDDGRLSFSYPGGWVAGAQPVPGEEDTLIIGFAANSRETVQKIANINGQTLSEFDAGLAFIAGNLGVRYSLPPGARARSVAEAVAARGSYTDFEIRDATVGGNPAAVIIWQLSGFDALDIVIEYGDDNFTLISMYTAPGSLANWEPFVNSFADAFHFSPPSRERAEALPLTQTFASANGEITVNYPENWLTRESGTATAYLATTDNALTANFGASFQPGETQILVSFWRADDLATRLDLPDNPTSLDVLNAAVQNTPTEEGVVFGQPVTGQIDGHAAAFVRVRANTFEGIALVYDYAPGVFAATQVMTAPGEIQLVERTFLDVIKSAIFGEVPEATPETGEDVSLAATAEATAQP